jgi:hypothetical protein
MSTAPENINANLWGWGTFKVRWCRKILVGILPTSSTLSVVNIWPIHLVFVVLIVRKHWPIHLALVTRAEIMLAWEQGRMLF